MLARVTRVGAAAAGARSPGPGSRGRRSRRGTAASPCPAGPRCDLGGRPRRPGTGPSPRRRTSAGAPVRGRAGGGCLHVRQDQSRRDGDGVHMPLLGVAASAGEAGGVQRAVLQRGDPRPPHQVSAKGSPSPEGRGGNCGKVRRWSPSRGGRPSTTARPPPALRRRARLGGVAGRRGRERRRGRRFLVGGRSRLGRRGNARVPGGGGVARGACGQGGVCVGGSRGRRVWHAEGVGEGRPDLAGTAVGGAVASGGARHAGRRVATGSLRRFHLVAGAGPCAFLAGGAQRLACEVSGAGGRAGLLVAVRGGGDVRSAAPVAATEASPQVAPSGRGAPVGASFDADAATSAASGASPRRARPRSPRTVMPHPPLPGGRVRGRRETTGVRTGRVRRNPAPLPQRAVQCLPRRVGRAGRPVGRGRTRRLLLGPPSRDGDTSPPGTRSRAARSASRTSAADPVGSPEPPPPRRETPRPGRGDPPAARSASRASSDGRGVMSSS